MLQVMMEFPEHTEIGLNLSYQPFNRLSLSTQGLYRRAGKVDRGSVRLDIGIADFTNPTILLPQAIYFDQSYSLMVSADGGSVYAEHHSIFGDLVFKFNAGLPLGNHQEIRSIILGPPGAFGETQASRVFSTQFNHEINAGEYIFAISYVNFMHKYHPSLNQLFSAQYNGEKFSINVEYLYRWNSSKDYEAFSDFKIVTESWYIQASYHFISQIQGTICYEMISLDENDSSESRFVSNGLPNHLAYAKYWEIGLRWDISPSLMIRTEFYHVHGTAWLAQVDNQIRSKTRQNWDNYV